MMYLRVLRHYEPVSYRWESYILCYLRRISYVI